MTKKLLILALVVSTGIVMISCNKPRRNTGRTYMPDMYYSRAHETYTSNEGLKQQGVNYTGIPVTGTIARGDLLPTGIKNDSAGYNVQSRNVKNPLDSSTIDMKEAERLYLIYCGICHGTKLDGKGPLFTSGVFPATPKDFTSVEMKELPEGTMFHSVTFGKNAMGSYASQLSPQQRWQVIAYIKSKQGAKSAQVAKTDSTTVKTDTTAVKPN